MCDVNLVIDIDHASRVVNKRCELKEARDLSDKLVLMKELVKRFGVYVGNVDLLQSVHLEVQHIGSDIMSDNMDQFDIAEANVNCVALIRDLIASLNHSIGMMSPADGNAVRNKLHDFAAAYVNA